MSTTQIAIIYLIIINILGFLIMGLDKLKAKNGSWRIPENTLFSFTILRWRNRHNYWNVCISS